MEPMRNDRITLVDLLDRVLDKGLLINADLIISVAGVPLIGVKLNAAIASIETMSKYGIMVDWCEAKKPMSLSDGEKMLKPEEGENYDGERCEPPKASSPKTYRVCEVKMV